MNEINQSAEQKPATPTPEAEGGQGGERTFTQEEVNRIVQERLNKERIKQGSPSEREAALTAREARLTCREYLLEAEAPLRVSGRAGHQRPGEVQGERGEADGYKRVPAHRHEHIRQLHLSNQHDPPIRRGGGGW